MNKIFNFLFFTAFYFGSLFASNIEFEADKTSLDTKNEYLLLEGNVSLKIENLQFKANKVSLDNKNKVFSSEKIRFSSLDNFLYGQTKFVGISEDKTILSSSVIKYLAGLSPFLSRVAPICFPSVKATAAGPSQGSEKSE